MMRRRRPGRLLLLELGFLLLLLGVQDGAAFSMAPGSFSHHCPRSLFAVPGSGAAGDQGQQQGQQHTRRRRQSLPEDLFLGNITTAKLMGWDVLEPEEDGYKRLGLTVPDVKAEDFRDLKVGLRFGFEGGLGGSTPRSQSGGGGGGASPRKRKQPVMITFETPYALCYPPGTRARGCQELITPSSAEEDGAGGGGGGAVGLPCTAPGSSCPFVTFECSKGHSWKAEPGTPACFYCPRCRDKTRHVRGFTAAGLDNTLPLPKLRGRRRVLDPAARFRSAVARKEGKVLGSYLGAKHKTLLRCGHGHEWEAAPENVLRGSWCPACAKAARAAKRALTLADMRVLAVQAGGAGARCLSEDYRGTATALLWACAGKSGVVHRFSRSPNYIQKGLAVGRAFCVECERLRRDARRR